jgi:hypothetical protein
MVRASPNINDFGSGEFSPENEGRVDIQRYGSGVRIMENFRPMITGPAVRRPGQKFVASTRFPAKTAVLVSFQYSTEQAYMLEFGDLYVRFYRNGGPLVESNKTITGATAANPVVITSAAHGYSNGEDVEISGIVGMTQLNGRRFRVANKAANTFELTDMHGANINGTAYTAYASGGIANRVYTLTSTYVEADLKVLKFAQSADVLYITHTSYVPRKLQRYAAVNWRLDQIDFQDGPYLPQNANINITLAVSAVTGAGITISSAFSKAATAMAASPSGAIRVTSAAHTLQSGDRIDIAGTLGTTEANGTWTVSRVNANQFDLNGSTFVNAWSAGGTITPHIFETTDVARLVRIQQASATKWGVAKITAVTNAHSVTADVLSDFGAVTASSAWRVGLYSTGGGYPAAVTFYGGRLYFGGCPLTPTRIDGSQVSNYEQFPPSLLTDSTVPDDLAVAYPLDSGDVNNVLWMKDDEKGLLVGTKGGEWLVRPSSLGGALTPTNVNATRSTTYGSHTESTPVRVGKELLFVQRKKRKIRNLSYTYDVDGLVADDVTLLAPHIGQPGISQLAFQAEPQGWVWCVRGTGKVWPGFGCLNYSRAEQKIGWSRQIIGGYSDTAHHLPSIGESVATIPSADEARDEVWTISQRIINGQTERYVEVSAADWERGNDQQMAIYVDSALTFDGSVAATLTPGAGATVQGATGVIFTAGSAVFVADDVGRVISMRYFDYTATDYEFPMDLGAWVSARATITGYTSSTIVTASIIAPWPSLTAVVSSGWRLSATTLGNLWHLEGETVKINAEGGTHPDVVVTNGRAALTRPLGYAVAGLKYASRLQTMRIEAGASDGTAQGKIKKFPEIIFRFLQSLGAMIASNFDPAKLIPLKYRNTSVPLGTPPPVEDGTERKMWDEKWEINGRIAVYTDDPFPFVAQAILPQVITNDKG